MKGLTRMDFLVKCPMSAYDASAPVMHRKMLAVERQARSADTPDVKNLYR